MKPDQEDTISCGSRTEVIKTKQRITPTQKKFKRKSCHSCVTYSVIIVLLLISAGVAITSIVFKKLSDSNKSYQSTSQPIIVSTHTSETTTKETNPSLIFDECEREFVALTTRLEHPILSLSVADVNNDSNIDILFIIENQNKLFIIFNLGNNQFEKVKEYDLFKSAGFLTVFITADINNDNSIDVIFGITSSIFQVTLFKNNGQGEFIDELYLPVDGSIHSLCTGDIDRNGYLDIIITIFQQSQIGIYYQEANSIFHSIKIYTIGKYPLALAIVDLNHDDYLDLIVTYPQASQFSTLFNKKSLESFEQIDYSTDIGPIFVSTADLNGDHHSDIVLINYFSNNIVLYRNDGTGRFSHWKNITGLNNPVSFVLTDYNNDTFIDIIIPNYHSNNIIVYFNNKNGEFLNSSTYITYPIPHLVTTTLINQDEKVDIIFSNENYIATILTRCDLP